MGRGSSQALLPSKDCICQARVPPVPSANAKNPGSCLWNPDQKASRPPGVGPLAPRAAVSVGKPCRLTAARKALVRDRPPSFLWAGTRCPNSHTRLPTSQ